MTQDLLQENRLLKEQLAALQERLASERELYEELMRMQDNLIVELSTPLLPVAERVLVMPVIGSIDQARAHRILEVLLKGVSEQRAHTVILDVSGIDRFHAVNASILLRATRAVRLLGAEVIITGVGAQHALALMALDLELGDLTMHRELRAGIEHALKRK